MFAPHSTSGKYSLLYSLLHHLVHGIKRFENTSSTEAALFEDFNVLAKQSFSMTSQGLSTRMQETVHSMQNAMCRVRGAENEVARSGCGAASSRKRQRLRKKEDYFVPNETFFSLKEMVKTTDTEGTGLLLESRYGRILVELFGKKALPFLAKCVKSVSWRKEDMYMTDFFV